MIMKIIRKQTLLILGSLLLIALPYIFKSPYLVQTFSIIIFYAYMGCCWNILGGLAGQISMGNSVYAGIGAYASTLLFIYTEISPWIGMLLGGLISGMISILIGLPTFRLRGTYYTLSTIAFLTVVRIIILANRTLFGLETRGAQGLLVPMRESSLGTMQFMSKIPFYYIILIMTILVSLLTYYLKHSKTGYYFAAIKANQDAAASLGINVTGYKLICSFISAFLTALGGTYYAQLTMYVDPSTLLGNPISQQIAIMPIVGGMGTVLGPIVGAVILVPLQEIARTMFGDAVQGTHLVIYGLIMMIIVVYAPGGIVSLFKKSISSSKRVVAKTEVIQNG